MTIDELCKKIYEINYERVYTPTTEKKREELRKESKVASDKLKRLENKRWILTQSKTGHQRPER